MFTPYPITTFNAVNAIKAVAEIKYVTYDKIRDLDLIAKEFKVRRHCYQQFTHWFISVTASTEKDTALHILLKLLHTREAILIKLRNTSKIILLTKESLFQ